MPAKPHGTLALGFVAETSKRIGNISKPYPCDMLRTEVGGHLLTFREVLLTLYVSAVCIVYWVYLGLAFLQRVAFKSVCKFTPKSIPHEHISYLYTSNDSNDASRSREHVGCSYNLNISPPHSTRPCRSERSERVWYHNAHFPFFHNGSITPVIPSVKTSFHPA